ncbi:ABC transporter ATP-binding protein [Oscillospiraceae bacterium HV4-5-C5C]|nr:ABC transporter ATP-binding protein [Oscillospiraceae bacterium HV4-5-C5C]
MKLTLRQVSRIYRRRHFEKSALDKVSLSIRSGERILISGPSGSGKTTLLNIMGLIDTDYSGLYSLDGQDARELSGRQRAACRNRIFGCIFQDYALLENESVFENVRIPLIYAGYSLRDQRRLVQAQLDRLELGAYLRQRPRDLSGGQRQRVAIARVLVHQPAVILADEPFSALDPALRRDVLSLLEQYLTPERCLIIATHQADSLPLSGYRRLTLTEGQLQA